MKRRHFIALASAGVGGALVAGRLLFPSCLRHGPLKPLSERAARFVERCFAGLERERIWDMHVHLIGLGQGTDTWVNPELMSWTSPVEQARFEAYLESSGITDPARADAQYRERLLALHRAANPAGKLVVLAFDYAVDEQGRELREQSHFYTGNAEVLALAEREPDVVPCVSIHPYRADAIDRLDEAAARGAVAVKWLPNAQLIDPLSARCDGFYRRLVETGLPLLTHTGQEMAIDSDEAQRYGNPLRLRRALDAGVKVIAAHCASLGEDEDFDAAERRTLPSFDLFMRLFEDRAHEGRLFGDISALVQVNRVGRPLRELLRAEELHPRLLFGSDYPLPAIDPLVSTRYLSYEGFLDETDAELCREVFASNPLLFDFVLKRSLRVAGADGREHRFQNTVFETERHLRRG